MKTRRILVADDNDAMREVIVSELGREFDVIQAVSDGESAVRCASQLCPNVAVLDISMPNLDGIEAARRIRKMSQGTIVVVLSACNDIDTCNAAFEAGATAYVLKPRLCADAVSAIKFALKGIQFVSPGLR